VLEAKDPINDEVNIFEYSPAMESWYLRADFEQNATPDEIAYLISKFSRLQAYTVEDSDELIKGIIGLVVFVAGAALAFVTGGVTVFLIRMAWEMLGFIYKKHQLAELEDSRKKMAILQQQRQAEMRDQAKLEAAIDNTMNLDIDSQGDTFNPYATGLFNPFVVELDLPKNDFAYGGEYYSPHNKLIKELT
jgi:hypothetical protein